MPAGRPSPYDKVDLKQVEKLCRLGATDKDIADFYEVSEATVNNWKIKHPEFLESQKKGKVLADAEVAEKLYQRALGYSHEAIKIMQYEGMPVTVKYIEHYPPDTTAAIFWLKNRQPEKWRDKQEIQHTGQIVVVDVPDAD